MHIAEAYVVYESNERVKGTCLTNMGIIRFRNQEYLKASENFQAAAESALIIIKQSQESGDKSEIKHNMHFYCKRKYLEALALFRDAMISDSTEEQKWINVERDINEIKKIMTRLNMDYPYDFQVCLNIFTSYCCLMTRWLISAEWDLQIAKEILESMENTKIDWEGVRIIQKEVLS